MRYYSTEQGRFISRDPLNYASGGMGLYESFGGNPVNLRDWWGLQSLDTYSEAGVGTGPSSTGPGGESEIFGLTAEDFKRPPGLMPGRAGGGGPDINDLIPPCDWANPETAWATCFPDYWEKEEECKSCEPSKECGGKGKPSMEVAFALTTVGVRANPWVGAGLLALTIWYLAVPKEDIPSIPRSIDPPARRPCPPCIPPVGTIAYDIHDAYHYIKSMGEHVKPHTHVYIMQQNPNTCQCFWKHLTDLPEPPEGAIPITPARTAPW